MVHNFIFFVGHKCQFLLYYVICKLLSRKQSRTIERKKKKDKGQNHTRISEVFISYKKKFKKSQFFLKMGSLICFTSIPYLLVDYCKCK